MVIELLKFRVAIAIAPKNLFTKMQKFGRKRLLPTLDLRVHKFGAIPKNPQK